MGTISNQRNAFEYENQGATTTVKGSAQVAEDGHIANFSGQIEQDGQCLGSFYYSESGENVNLNANVQASILTEVISLIVASVTDIKNQMAE